MDIGISIFPTDYSIDVAIFAEKVEEYGFESLWVPEHSIIPVETVTPWPGSSDGKMPKQYADIVDIGFESSRPGANPISEKDELNRLFDILGIITNFTQTLSIDTYKPYVAKIALENGFNMINDIKGSFFH